jgi:hypothetical protein
VHSKKLWSKPLVTRLEFSEHFDSEGPLSFEQWGALTALAKRHRSIVRDHREALRFSSAS